MEAVLPLRQGDPERLGAYELVGRLGEGGQGTVYLGQGPHERVAVKLLHAQLSGDHVARARFVRELAAIQRIAGFCTAQVYASDVEGDRPYIVSEFVPGPSLHELVREEGPRTEGSLMRLAVGTATALTAIHRAGIVHRDFKPPNVLMGPDGPRVIDFGIARALDNVGGRTVTGHIVGTPAYMAPEQFTENVVGPAADLFAWGATMLYAATGESPFAGGQVFAIMHKIRFEHPDLSPLPPELKDVVQSCLAKDPNARPTSDDLLWTLLGQTPAHFQQPPAAPPTPQRPSNEKPHPITQELTFPGAAYPTATPAYPTPTPEYPPGQGYPIPTPEYPPPTQDHPAPAQGYVAPGQDHPAPAQGYAPPGQGYPTPGSQYPPAGPDSPTPAHDYPAQGYPARGQGYPPAGPEHHWPARDYPAPSPEYPARTVRRSVPLAIALILATLLSLLDMAALFVASGKPADTAMAARFLILTAVYAGLGVVTLFGVVAAWRGHRSGIWTVLGSRLARAAVGISSMPFVAVLPMTIAVQGGGLVLVALLLVWALRKSSAQPPPYDHNA